MVPHELPICYKCEGILLPTSANSLVSGTITVSPHGPQLVGCVGQLVVSLTLFVSPSLLPTLPHDFPNPVQCWAMSVCIWFHLLLLNPSPTQFSPPSTSDVYCTFFWMRLIHPLLGLPCSLVLFWLCGLRNSFSVFCSQCPVVTAYFACISEFRLPYPGWYFLVSSICLQM